MTGITVHPVPDTSGSDQLWGTSVLKTGRKSWIQNGIHFKKVVENDQAKVLQTFKIQTDKLVFDGQNEKAVVVRHSTKWHQALEKYQGLREEFDET